MKKDTIFYLARHGQTQWNIEHRIQGQLDSCLTVEGKAQAMRLASSCCSLGITQILTSPLGRAVETADICGTLLNLPVKKVQGFEERNFGLWQGKLTPAMALHSDYDEIVSQMTDCKPEQGESAKQVFTRFDFALKSVLKVFLENSLKHSLKEMSKKMPKDTPLIVIHGELLRCFMTQFNKGKLVSTGYDYPNGKLIKIVYNHELDQFYYHS